MMFGLPSPFGLGLVWLLSTSVVLAEFSPQQLATLQWENEVPILCSRTAEHIVICDGVDYTSAALDPKNSPRFWYHFCICTFLVLFAGLMSGLTIGLLSLDSTSLLVLKNGGSPSDRKHATRILPLVEQKHMLLVTLLLCNAAAMEALPVFLGHMVPEALAILLSVTAVLLFGEIIPQAVCSKYGLAVGYYATPLVRLLMLLCTPISFPIAWLLDRILGVDHGQFYRRQELKELVALHGIGNRPKQSHDDGERTPLLGSHSPESRGRSSGDTSDEEDEPLTFDEVTIIRAAIEMTAKTVGDAMIPLEAVLLVNVNMDITYEWVSQVLEAGHSRIPIYEGDWNNIIGFMMVRNLVLCDFRAGGISIREVPMYQLFHVNDDYKLYDMLNKFQTGKSHMAVVHDSETNSIGIITLEDVIEELINEEIVDETDVYVDVQKRIHVERETKDGPMVVRRQRSTIYPSLAGKATGHMGALVGSAEAANEVVPALQSYAVSSFSKPYDQTKRLSEDIIVANKMPNTKSVTTTTTTIAAHGESEQPSHATHTSHQHSMTHTNTAPELRGLRTESPPIYQKVHARRTAHRKYLPMRKRSRVDTHSSDDLLSQSPHSASRLHAPTSCSGTPREGSAHIPPSGIGTPREGSEPTEWPMVVVHSAPLLAETGDPVDSSGTGVNASVYTPPQTHSADHHPTTETTSAPTLAHSPPQQTSITTHASFASRHACSQDTIPRKCVTPVRLRRFGPSAGLTPVTHTSHFSTRASVDSGQTVRSEDIQDVPILSPRSTTHKSEKSAPKAVREGKRRSYSEY